MGERNIYRPAMLAVGVIAFVLSVILTVHTLSGAGLVGCTAGTGCDAVTHSKWSVVFGSLPVSALAALLYAAVLACVLLLPRWRGFVPMLVTLATAALVSAAWFTGLQAFKIHRFCPYCMAAHLCGVILFVLVVLFLRRQEEGRIFFRIGISFGALLAGMLIAAQMRTVPQVHADQGRVEQSLPIPDPVASPCVGPADARCCIALLYDYQCPHCRVIHGLLDEVVAHYGGEVCFVICPTPLSQECNPYLPGGTDRYEGTCALARQALGLWNIDPVLFEAFDNWLFATDGIGRWQARKVEEAAQYAASLAAGRRPDEGWMERYLRASLELFARSSSLGKGGIPRLVYGTSWVIPEVEDVQGLIHVIDELIQEP